MSKDFKPVLNNLANLAIALENFVTSLVNYTETQPELMVSESQVNALLKRQAKAAAPEAKTAEEPATPPTISIEEVRKVLAEKSQNGKQPEVKALIASYGVRRLTEIDPGCYAELLEKAEAI